MGSKRRRSLGRLKLWVLCAAVALSLPPTAASADATPVHLDWERPLGSTCPPASVLERDVEQTLDRSVFTPSPNAELLIQGFIEEHDSGTLVRLTARHRDGSVLGTRELHAVGGGCAALRGDIVLVLTLLVEREQIMSDASRAVDASIGLASSLLLHVLPRWSAGVGPVLVVSVANVVQLRADLAYFLPVAVRTSSGVAADMHALSLGLRACPRLYGASDSAFSLHACGGVQLGTWLIAQTEPRDRALQVRLLAQGLLDVRAGLRLGQSVTLELGAGPSLAISRTSMYAANDQGERDFLYRVPLVGAQLQLALVF